MAEVSFRNVRKNYGTLAVIHGISVDVSDGPINSAICRMCFSACVMLC